MKRRKAARDRAAELIGYYLNVLHRAGITVVYEDPEGEGEIELPDVQAACEKALDAILTRSPDTRAGWVVYILEGLDDAELRRPFADVLEEVRASLETRLEDGGW